MLEALRIVPGTQDHVVLEAECIDRMYLNVYVPQLQRVGGVVLWYLRGRLGQRLALGWWFRTARETGSPS